jgi:hypothetical protein
MMIRRFFCYARPKERPASPPFSFSEQAVSSPDDAFHGEKATLWQEKAKRVRPDDEDIKMKILVNL